jgi:hypothetical protein
MITNDLQNRIHFGDREAFLAVYHEYGPGAYTAAKQALASESLAKSAVKQAFLTLYEEILTQSEDFDIPVRIRELTEREIFLLQLVCDREKISQGTTIYTQQPHLEPEQFSARGAFAQQSDVLLSLPELERARSFRRPRRGLFLRRQTSKSVDRQVAFIWKLLLVLVDLFLLWILTGMLMGLGYLPVVDLGYSWFSHALYLFTLRFA